MRGRTSQSGFSRSQSCSTKRSIRNLSPLTESIPHEKCEGVWAHFGIAAVQLACAYIFLMLGESATADVSCQGEGTAVYATQRAFVLLALR